MAKSLWLIISTIAVANILTLLGVGGWLFATDRLSPDRLEGVRTIFEISVTAQDKDEQAALAAANNKSLEERLEAGEGTAPVPAMVRNMLIHEQDEISQQRLARSQREQEDLLRVIDDRQRELAVRESVFEQDKAAWEAMRKRLTAQESAEQFQKTVKNYETQKPAIARDILETLINSGGRAQAVAYLNAMSPRATSKVISAFAKDDPALAAELLERLRTFGIETPEQGLTSDDDDLQPELAANP